jgi:hypothetical protein
MSAESDLKRFRYSPFWPVLLPSLSLLLVLGAEVMAGFEQRAGLQRQSESLMKEIRQARETEKRLEALAGALVDLSATDPDAKTIVDKYKISRTAPKKK